MTASSPPPFLDGLRALHANYQGFLLDLWGVTHNGERLFDGVLPCLEQLHAHNKAVIFLSNAPRRAPSIRQQLTAFGIPRALYQDVVSSGEVAWSFLKQKSQNLGPYATWGNTFYHIGPARDTNVYEDLPLTKTDTIDAADFILNSGPSRNESTVADYHELLQRAHASNTPMICLNPDLEVLRGTQRVICAGALAQYYQSIGGTVTFHGKPYPDVYDHTCRLLDMPANSLLAIGDSLRTDIAGAHSYGIDSILVLSGIHTQDSLPPLNPRPNALMHQLAW